MRERTASFSDYFTWAFDFPMPGKGSFLAIQRNFFQFSYSLWTNLLFLGVEPMLYLYAFGFGLGFYLGDILGVPYTGFFGVSLLFIAGLMNTFMETTFCLSRRVHNRSSYLMYLLSPIPLKQVALGEILWGTIKGMFGASVVGFILLVLGVVNFKVLCVGLALAAMVYWSLSAFGLLLVALAKSENTYIYVQSLVLIPMILFSGTYFPIEFAPDVVEWITLFSPITHGLYIVRSVAADSITYNVFLSLAVLFCYMVFLTNYGVVAFEKKVRSLYQ